MFLKYHYIIFSLFLLISSCATKEKIIDKKFNAVWKKYFEKSYDKTSQITIFIVTNRKKNSEKFSCEMGSFGVFKSDELTFGKCNINVPKDHEIGIIPDVVTKKGFIHKEFKILQESSLDKDQLVLNIKNTKRNPLIFVHGFNVKYHEALIRAASLAYDLKYQGDIILFSWPAGGSSDSLTMINNTYKNNLLNSKNSINDFSKLLVSLKNNNITPNILVHSMGHQVVLNSLDALSKKYPKDTFVNNLILNAPDFAIDQFIEIKGNIQKIANKVTIYCAKNDKAILVSHEINKSKRVGECLVIDSTLDKKIELIDVSEVNNSFLGHGYYYSKEVLADVFQNLVGIDASKRIFLAKKDFFEKQYYLKK